MKTRLITLLFVCLFTLASSFAANRYWVGTTLGIWSSTDSWSETSGGAKGASVPTATDNVIFDNTTGNANPTVALEAAITVDSMAFSVSNVTFSGKFAIVVSKMMVDSSQVKFVNDVLINSSLAFKGTKKDKDTDNAPRIIHSPGAPSIYKFVLGNGGEFKLTGNNITNYFDGAAFTSFRYNTTSALTVFYKPNSSLGGLQVTKGLITIGNSTTTLRLNFYQTTTNPTEYLNNQELILAPNTTFTLNTGGSSGFTELANGGTVNASASGSKFLIKSTHASVLDGTKRIFKTAAIINNLEFNSTGTTFNLFEPITVRTLTLTAGIINNTTNGITVEAGGGEVTVAGSTTVPVVTAPAATRYWVGGSSGYWASEANWGTASGSTTTPGLPGFGDDLIFDATPGNESPTITLSDNVAANSMTFTNNNVTFAGAFGITTNNMTVTNSNLTFVDHTAVNKALTMDGASSTITQLSTTSGRAFKMGNGDAFTLTGNSPTNYFTGNTNAYYTFNTSSPLTVYFNPTITTAAAIVVTKGLITLGNSVNTNRLTLNALNSQELILGQNVTLTMTLGGTSSFSELAAAGVVNASAPGSKFAIASVAPTFLNAGIKRIFKEATPVEELEMNSTLNSFILGYPITVKKLTLTEGNIDNTSNNITIATGGKIITTNGTTSAAVIAGLPSEPINVVATAGIGEATVAFNAPDGDGGSAILDYTVIAEPGGFSATGSESPLTVKGLTNGTSYTFKVKATNNIGESNASMISNEVTPSLNAAIQSVTENNTAVFNYKNDVVNITYNSDSSNKAVFKLMSLNGQVLVARTLSTQTGKNTNSISVGNLPKGMYLVSLSDGTNTLTDKIIKQ